MFATEALRVRRRPRPASTDHAPERLVRRFADDVRNDGLSDLLDPSFVVCVLAGIDVRIACPPAYRFHGSTVAELRSLGAVSVRFFADPVEAVHGTAAVYTDSWVSMGREAERGERLAAFADYQVNEGLLVHAPEAIVMHCLPATRGEQITGAVLDGDRSVVREQARTRHPMQQAILARVLGESDA